MKIFVETERILLREILPSDIDGMFKLDSDPEVHQFLGNKPISDRTEVIHIINSVRQQYADYGIGRWAIIEKKTNEFIGWSGIKYVTDLTNNHCNYFDLGYRLRKEFWGKGIATETAILSLEYAFKELKLKEVYAAANCANIGSNKILQKIGLNLIETFLYKDFKCNWYKIDKNEYEKIECRPANSRFAKAGSFASITI